MQKGIFGEMTCGEDRVRKIDAASCVHSEAVMQSIPFEKFTSMTTLRLGDVPFLPPSLISLMRSEATKNDDSSLVSAVETLPEILDFSNQRIDDFPEPMKKLLGAYQKPNVKSLNFSGNALDSATLLDWLNSVTACSEDGSRGFCALRTVDLSRNILSDVPFVGLGDARFPKLSKIIARENKVYKINAQTAEWALKESTTISLWNNNISDIALSAVDVGSRSMSALLNLISQVASVNNVEVVSLNGIKGLEGGFTGITNASLKLPKLKAFSIVQCNIESDSIPSEIGLLSTLEAISAIKVDISGSILSAGPTDPIDSINSQRYNTHWIDPFSARPSDQADQVGSR